MESQLLFILNALEPTLAEIKICMCLRGLLPPIRDLSQVTLLQVLGQMFQQEMA
jgi:hypothetical protein